jgi:peptidoglycan/LPS O-acetylase OafA/YrhL
VTVPALEHVAHVDVLRLLPMVGVVATHVLIFTQPPESTGSNAALMFLHANREVFFFVSAFVLFYASGAASTPLSARDFWRRRYPLVVLPYLAWTLVYWLQTSGWVPWPPGPALRQLGVDVATGWFHLYFLLVTMQLYLVFPLLARLVRRTRGRHGWLLAASLLLQLGTTAVMQYQWGWIPGWLQPWFQGAQTEATSYQLYFVLGALAAAHLAEVVAWLRAHRAASLLGAGLAAAAAAGAYLLNLRLGESPEAAAGVFQPAVALAVGAALVGLFWVGEVLAGRLPPAGRVWRGLRSASRASFGVYLGHMLPLQLLLLTPLASLTSVGGLPAPLRALAALAIVLGTTFAGILALQRTPLSLLLTGRRRERGPGRGSAGRWRAGYAREAAA